MAATVLTPSIIDSVKADSFYTVVVSIPDDNFYSFTPKSPNGQIFISSTSLSGHGLAWFRSSATVKYAGAANFDCVSTALTGTTGVDTHMTLGVSAGVLYLENRVGSALEVTITVIGSDARYD